MTPILILAGGASRRMGGRDKLLETVGETPLLRLVAQRAVATDHPVFVALPATSPGRDAALLGLKVSLLHLPEAEEGQSGTLRAGVAALPDCAAFLVLLADLPEITSEDMTAVLSARDQSPSALIWRGATEAGAPGHPILFDASLRPEFSALSGDSGGRQIVHRHGARTHLVPLPGNRALCDLDTPEAWAAWRAEQDRKKSL